MDLNRLFTMLLRMVMGKAMRHGIDYAARRGKPAAELTPEERAQAKAGRQAAKRAQQAARLVRRIGR